MRMFSPAFPWISSEVRVRRSRRSLDLQTRQLQPTIGTPVEVPLPRIIAFILYLYSFFVGVKVS